MVTQKKVEVFEFHPDHLAVMEVREEEAQGVLSLPDQYERFLMMSKCSIESSTFTYGDKMLFCAGYISLWPGVIECWMVPSKYVHVHKLAFCKLLKEYVNDIIVEQKCHRFQTTAPDDELHARWMKFLGLKKEGVLEKYTHTQQDYCMYARVKQCQVI